MDPLSIIAALLTNVRTLASNNAALTTENATLRAAAANATNTASQDVIAALQAAKTESDADVAGETTPPASPSPAA